MAALFGEERLEFFHLVSVVSQFWRSTNRVHRLNASMADDLAIRALGLVAAFRGEGSVTDTPRFARSFGSFCYLLEQEFAVPRAPQPKPKEGLPEWKGFLEYRLDETELEELDSWSPDASELMEAAHGMLVAGYTFTLSWSARTGQACFSLRDNNPDRKTAGYCMTTFDANCALALKAGVYKQKLVLRDDWTPLVAAGKSVRRG